MARRNTELRDLRSLERRSMYSIFSPLDAEEALPREMVLEARRHRTVGRRELAGVMWLPALCGVLVVASWARLPALPTLALVGGTLAGFSGFAFSRRPRTK
jgi:hypothetical protein